MAERADVRLWPSVRTTVPLVALALGLGLGSACRSAIRPDADPFAPADARVHQRDLYDVDWWVRLIDEAPLLEYMPRELASPAVERETGRVFALTRDGFVRALSVSDGRLLWTYKTFGPFNAGPTVHRGVLFVPGGDGALYALRTSDGSLLWRFAAGEEFVTSPLLVGDDRLLVSAQSDTLIAVDAKTGKWLWQYRREPPPGFTIRGMSAPVAEGDAVYVGFSDGTVVSLALADGVERWSRSLSPGGGEFTDVDATPVIDGELLYAASFSDGVFALDRRTGDVRWHTSRSGITSLLGAGRMLFSSGDSQLGALSRATGRVLWSVRMASKSVRRPLALEGLLLVPTDDALTFSDATTGQVLVRWDPGEGVSATPTKAGPRVYVLSNNGYLYALRVSGAAG